MKFFVPNYSFLQNPWLGGYRPQIPVLSVLSWICWNPLPEQNTPLIQGELKVWFSLTTSGARWQETGSSQSVYLLRASLTHSLTPWSRDLFEKLSAPSGVIVHHLKLLFDPTSCCMLHVVRVSFGWPPCSWRSRITSFAVGARLLAGQTRKWIWVLQRELTQVPTQGAGGCFLKASGAWNWLISV